MRIISGEYKGRRITVPKKFKGRPTTDFAKEGIFNILNNLIDYEDVKFLDLFAGTGSISYEMLSRGCQYIRSVEKSIVHTNFINETFRGFDAKNARCIKKDAFLYIENCSESFDLIIADPPFDMEDTNKLPDLIFNSKILNANGMFILEHDKHESYTRYANFVQVRKYGNVHFSIFKHLDEKVVSENN